VSDFKMEFTVNDVLTALDRSGLKHRKLHRYILTQCPKHDDRNPSAQIYLDDMFVNCHAVCGRFPIQEVFPHLTDKEIKQQPVKKKEMLVSSYKVYDQYAEWEKMPLIPRDHQFKGLPLEVLDDMGWRWVEDQQSYYIPYFNTSRTQIPFAQWRHLTGERRFTFLKDAKPIAYGLWNLEDNPILFVVEGASDAAVLEHAAIPWIAMPSAASGSIIKALAEYCIVSGIKIAYAGDRDLAGDKLREALDEVCSYRVKQVPSKYKDWGEFFEAEGLIAVNEYCMVELGYQASITSEVTAEKTDFEEIEEVFPGAKVLTIVGDGGKNVGVEQQKPPSPPGLF
jgi:hypothetical protein